MPILLSLHVYTSLLLIISVLKEACSLSIKVVAAKASLNLV